jgi:hypothetical protein
MGFIPIILTLSAAIILFFMAVHNYLNLKKSQIQGLQSEMIKGFSGFDSDLKVSSVTDWDWVAKKYLELKKKHALDPNADFDKTLKKPFQQAKILKSQYNKLISKKPYSFVAQVMGHKTML